MSQKIEFIKLSDAVRVVLSESEERNAMLEIPLSKFKEAMEQVLTRMGEEERQFVTISMTETGGGVVLSWEKRGQFEVRGT